LQHYAVDWGRLPQVSFDGSSAAPTWWLITDRSFDAGDYLVLESHRLGALGVYKLQAKSGAGAGH
jgi:hypothetical protein